MPLQKTIESIIIGGDVGEYIYPLDPLDPLVPLVPPKELGDFGKGEITVDEERLAFIIICCLIGT